MISVQLGLLFWVCQKPWPELTKKVEWTSWFNYVSINLDYKFRSTQLGLQFLAFAQTISGHIFKKKKLTDSRSNFNQIWILSNHIDNYIFITIGKMKNKVNEIQEWNSSASVLLEELHIYFKNKISATHLFLHL